MRTPIHATLAAAALALTAALIVGCEHDMDPLIPSDGTMLLTANPTTIVLDPNDPFAPRDPETGLLMGTSSVFARLFDKTGNPLQGIGVAFTTSSGRLASAGNPGQPPRTIFTDPNGLASDTLTIKESDPVANTVTVTSGTKSEEIVVSRANAACENTAPMTNAGADQTEEGDVLAVPIVLDGRASSDAETPLANLLFVWDCGNNQDPVAAPGQVDLFPQVVQCSYNPSTTADDAVYTATLTVTDTGNDLRDPRTGEFLCKESKSDTVKITITSSAR